MTANIEKKTKQPHEVLDFDFEAMRRMDDDDVITDASASVTGDDAALLLEAVTWTDTRVKVWLAAGNDLKNYKITVLITTFGGRVFEGEFVLFVKER